MRRITLCRIADGCVGLAIGEFAARPTLTFGILLGLQITLLLLRNGNYASQPHYFADA